MERDGRRLPAVCASSFASCQQYLTETFSLVAELGTGYQLALAAQLLLYLVLLHFGSCLFQTLRNGLSRKALLIGAVDGIGHVGIVPEGQQCLLWQKLQQRLLVLGLASQLGHDVHLFATALRQLVLHLKRADAVYLVAEEVDTEGELAAEAVHVEDRATQGILPRLVDIIHLTEAEILQRLFDGGRTDGLPRLERQRATVEPFLRHHHLGHGLRVADDI